MVGELLAEEKKELFLDKDIFCGEGNGEGFYYPDCLFYLWGQGMKRYQVTDYLIGID